MKSVYKGIKQTWYYGGIIHWIQTFWLFLQEIIKTDIEDKIPENEKIVLVEKKKKRNQKL